MAAEIKMEAGKSFSSQELLPKGRGVVLKKWDVTFKY
jgi:hypothetical protein